MDDSAWHEVRVDDGEFSALVPAPPSAFVTEYEGEGPATLARRERMHRAYRDSAAFVVRWYEGGLPAEKDGRPVSQWIVLEYNFNVG